MRAVQCHSELEQIDPRLQISLQEDSDFEKDHNHTSFTEVDPMMTTVLTPRYEQNGSRKNPYKWKLKSTSKAVPRKTKDWNVGKLFIMQSYYDNEILDTDSLQEKDEARIEFKSSEIFDDIFLSKRVTTSFSSSEVFTRNNYCSNKKILKEVSVLKQFEYLPSDGILHICRKGRVSQTPDGELPNSS